MTLSTWRWHKVQILANVVHDSFLRNFMIPTKLYQYITNISTIKSVIIIKIKVYLPYFLRNMLGCMCQTGPLKLRWSRGYIYDSFYYHHQIRSINLPHFCHSPVVVCQGWLYHHMLSVPHISRESWVFCILLLPSIVVRAKNNLHYDPTVVFVCLPITLPNQRTDLLMMI